MTIVLLRILFVAMFLSEMAAPTRSVAPMQQRTSAFKPAACMFDVPTGLTEGSSLECGYLTVPEQHAVPDGPSIQLAVAIVKSITTPAAASDPLVMLQGGPGGSTIDTYIQLIGLGRLNELRMDRDLVLFDQRGTLYSKPALTCPEQLKLTEDTIERRVPRDEAYRLSLAATSACYERLVAEGVNLAAYDSVENASDIEALRIALGYQQINIYGVSYGTLLALHTMREHPQGIRSVILDAVVPTQTNFILEAPRSQDRAFTELFAACVADQGCNTAYPNLEQVFFDLVAALNREPARVLLTDPETKKSYNAVIDGDTIQSLIFQLLYSTEIIPALPHVIYAMRAGDFSFMQRIAPQILFDRTFASGMYESVICAEDADFQSSALDVQGIRPQFAEYATEDAENFLQGCQIWNVTPLDPSVDQPVTSTIPTLVLNGRFDPITPPANGIEAARTISPSYVYTFGYSGHGAATTGSCPESIMRQFLRDPSRAPDSACIADKPAPTFISPATVRLAPSLGRILSGIEQNQWAPLLLPMISLLFLLSLVIVWPIGWLVRIVRGRPAERSGGLMLARWSALLVTVLGAICMIGLVVVVFQLAFAGEDLILLFGVPASVGWLLVLPWVVVVGTLLMVVGGWMIWSRRSGSLIGRIYYTLLVMAAIGLSVGLGALVQG